jgi:lipoprotein-releasing system permease protein
LGSSVWDLFVGAGTTLTLTVIVMIALALNALALFYLSSAVVVLERFARPVQRVRWVVFFGLIAAAGTAFLVVRQAATQDGGGGELGGSPWAVLASCTVVTAISISLCTLALRRLTATRLGTVVLCTLGVGASLLVGGAARIDLAVAAPAFTFALALLITWRRRRKLQQRGAGTAEQQLRWLSVALALGPILALVLDRPDHRVFEGGLAILQIVVVLILFGLLPLGAAGLVEMRRSAEWFLAVRYLVARRRQVYVSAITLLCIGGIAAGVWLIVTVMSVMNGFERAWREQIVGDLAHFTVHSGLGRISDYADVLDLVRSTEDVEAASPYIDAEGMVRSAGGRLFGVRMRGIDPLTVDSVTGLSERLVEGSLAALEGRAGEELPGIVIGEPLAEKLGAETGSDLVLISPFGGPRTPLGQAPRLKKFKVVGVFRSQLYQFGEIYTYVRLSDAQDFLRSGDVVQGIEARTPDLYTSRATAEKVRAGLGAPYYTRDWKDHFPVFFAALRDNRSMMTLLLGMIMVVAAFMIVATLMMMIMEKSSDIAILKAMGAQDAMIERVFAIEGTLIGLSGTAIGILAGLAVTSRLDWIQSTIEAVTGVDTLPESIYQLSTLPADHDPLQLLGVGAMAMVLALGATLVPARQAAHFDPVEGLRSE